MNTNLISYHISSDIGLSLNHDTVYHTEALLQYHLLVWVIAGQTRIIQSDASTTFGAGDTFVLSCNQVVKFVNSPVNGVPFRAMIIVLSKQKLKQFYAPWNVIPSLLPMDVRPFHVKNHAQLDNSYRSVINFYDRKEKLTEEAAAIKISELLKILRSIAPPVDNILSNVEAPGKNDLVKFMEGHFIFNITIEEFGYLTGRSVSTFNRDFRSAFNMPPQKWLTKKRLALAHQQLTVCMKKPIDVYHEVGFKDLSHFSFAFRKCYGYPPTAAMQRVHN